MKCFFDKEVETSNNLQKLTIEAFEKANLENVGLKDANAFYEIQMKYYVQEADQAKVSAQKTGKEAMKDYTAYFHLTEECYLFDACWRRFAYVKVVARVGSFTQNSMLLN